MAQSHRVPLLLNPVLLVKTLFPLTVSPLTHYLGRLDRLAIRLAESPQANLLLASKSSQSILYEDLGSWDYCYMLNC